jgi:phytol kinase
MTNFWLNEAVKVLLWYSSAYLLGLLAVRRGVAVNYTRKIFLITMFLFPQALASLVPFKASLGTSAVSWLVFLGCTLTLCEPLRSRSGFLATAFAAIDRPEDRPFTLTWLTTQILVTYAVFVVMLLWLGRYEKTALAYIMVLVMGVGDALAEPVGYRFGRHKYRTRALFTERTYTRSLEGSACVLLSAVLAILLVGEHLTGPQFWLALFVIPPVVTVAEALSPHTWDGPFLYLTGGGATVAVLELA